MQAARAQVHLVDELPVVHVEVDPLAGDEAAVDLSGAGRADVLAGGEGEGVQGIGLGLVEVLPRGKRKGYRAWRLRLKRLGEGRWVKRFRSLARARALLCLPPGSMAAGIARVRIADAGVLAWGSSL